MGVSQFPSRHVIHNVQIVVWYNVAELIAAEKNSFKQESVELEVAPRTLLPSCETDIHVCKGSFDRNSLFSCLVLLLILVLQQLFCSKC